MNEDDRELLMLLGSVGIRVGKIVTGLFEVVTGLFEDSLSCEVQSAFENQLAELAEGFRQRVLKTPFVIDGKAT